MALEFHPLTVATVDRQTEDAVAITFDVPSHLTDTFAFEPGQHVTVRSTIDGVDVRRSYSICADSATGTVRVGIRRIVDGAFSTYATTELHAGDVIEVMPPVGEFTHDPATPGRFVAIAAGSGITPVLSMVTSNLEAQPASEWTLLYGNRTANSIMFIEEIQRLKDRHTGRFQIVNVLSREPHQVPLFEGRLNAAKLDSLLGVVVEPSSVDGWYLCGPLGMVEDARATLAAAGVDASIIHEELFFDERVERVPEADADKEGLSRVTITLDGRSSTVYVDPDGPSILDYARTVRSEAPFACKGGMCATCKGAVVEGEVRMDKNYALTSGELEAGFVLTCQSHPVTDAVTISYDTHGGIGR